MFDAAECEIQSIELVLVRDGCATLKKTGTWKTSNLSVKPVISVRVIISNYIYPFILISIRIINFFHTISYHNNIRIFSFLSLRFHHIHCLQVFSHPQINLKTGQQGCRSHGRVCQVHFYPSKAMAEAMDAADMAGLHGMLLKLQRNLGDDFSMFWTISQLFWCFHLVELIEHVLQTVMKNIRN